MTATTVGPELRRRLNAIVAEIGPYPHAQLTPQSGCRTVPIVPGEGIKTQGTRLIGLQCPRCDYIIYTTRKWIARYHPHLPACPCGAEFGPQPARAR
jgi:hypothetical protein